MLLVLDAGCARLIKPPQPALKVLTGRDVRARQWIDDMNFQDLEKSIEHSISFFKGVPDKARFQYGELTYSPEEMSGSMKLFISIIKEYRGESLAREIKEKFLFFESVNSDGGAFFTGYYEPVIEGSLEPTDQFPEPLYETPDDLIEVDLSLFAGQWQHEKVVGRLSGNRLIPYDSRDEIVYLQSLKDRARPIVYVSEIELFFLQIQGSGIIKLRDGSMKKVNYAQKNGHPYRAVGRVLSDRIPPHEMSLQAIKDYLYAHPDKVKDILSYNQSYTFFREIDEGPLGNIEVPLTPGRSIAMDRRTIPRGGLVFIETEIPLFDQGKISDWIPVRRFALVQDTGGAIQGHGRVDLFFGHGKDAEMVAGHLKRSGRCFLIVARKEFLR
jgi:membrane-bound lytic murein transglycosylase A